MDTDLLERCRAGDREAFRTLVSFWGDIVLRIATLVSGDRARATSAVRDTLIAGWRALPSFHSERPFRPWLLRAVLSACEGPPDHGEAAPHRACLDALEPDARAAAILQAYADLGAVEIAQVIGTSLVGAAGRLRKTMKELDGCLGADAPALRGLLEDDVRGLELAPWFFDEEVAPKLTDPVELEVRRLVRADAGSTWRVLTDAALLPSWSGASGVRARGTLGPESRIRARGSIAELRHARDESLVTRAEEPRLLTWATRSSPELLPGAIEFRWSIEIAPSAGGCEIRHALHGVAFPAGPVGSLLARAYARVSHGMTASMHRGIERLASLAEARAR